MGNENTGMRNWIELEFSFKPTWTRIVVFGDIRTWPMFAGLVFHLAEGLRG